MDDKLNALLDSYANPDGWGEAVLITAFMYPPLLLFSKLSRLPLSPIYCSRPSFPLLHRPFWPTRYRESAVQCLGFELALALDELVNDTVADILAKPLPIASFYRFRFMLEVYIREERLRRDEKEGHDLSKASD